MSFNHPKKDPLNCLQVIALLVMGLSNPVSASDFFSVTPETTAPHDVPALYKIFMTGVGTYDSTMDGKLYPYPLTQNGAVNAPLYNGCYDSKNNRIAPLDSDNSCATTIAARPADSIFRLFMGYKVDCADSTTTPGTCQDMALLINCQLTQVQTGTSAFDGYVPTRVCSTGNPIVRRAKANTSNTPAIIGCLPGTDGTTYPICTPCADGKYNDVIGANNYACKLCPTPTMAGAASQPGTYTTGGTGAVSAAQCEIAATDPWSCATGFSKTSDNQLCDPSSAAAPCTLSLGVVPTNPTAVGMNDGNIIATYSGANGAVTAFKITAPTSINPTSSSGSTSTFLGLGHNTYTLSATDSVCTTTASVSLTAPTSVSCASCPLGSLNSGNFCEMAAPCPAGFTLDGTGTKCTLACTTGSALGTCGLSMAVTSTDNPTTLTSTGAIYVSISGAVGAVALDYAQKVLGGVVANYGTNGSVSGLPSGTFTVTATDTAIPGCKTSVSRTIKYSPALGTTSCLIQGCKGVEFKYTCWFDSSGTPNSYQEFSTMFVPCSPDTPNFDPNKPLDSCKDTSLCTPVAAAPPETLPACGALTCDSGTPRYFWSVEGVNAFTNSNAYTNSKPGSTCTTAGGFNLVAVCSSATPNSTQFEGCTFNSTSTYYRTPTDELCK